MRLIYWISSYEIIFKNSDLIFRSKVINNIVKQTKHLFKNISLVSSGVDKIKSLAALILVGNSFEQYEEYTQYGLKNLEDELGNFVNKDGFVKKTAIKRINDDKKFRKDYDSHINFGNEIISKIVKKLELIDSSLLSNMKNIDDDDW